jgi:hypothetical protein
VLLADDAGDIAERIRQHQAEVRERLLQRIAARIPKTDNLKDLAIAYGIVTDKALLAAGKPTSIRHEAFVVPDDANEEELVAVAEELRRRRLEFPA